VNPSEIRYLAAALDAGLPAAIPHAPASLETTIVSDVLRLAQATGTPRPRLLRLIADALDDANATTRDVVLASVAARQSAVVLAALPLVTAVAAGFFGVNVLGFLVGNALGIVCSGLGVGATVAGWRWMARLRRTIVAPPVTAGLLLDCVAEVLSVVALSPTARAILAECRSRWAADAEWAEMERVWSTARDTGVPVAGLLREAALETRRRVRFEVRSAIELLPGKMLVPLGVCLFPAFITLTVIPAVASMAGGLLS
jgi:tight adherence protein B